MSSIKLNDLEIKEGFLCKDGVRLTGTTKLSKEQIDKIGGIIPHFVPFNHTKDCKVKSATIWTEVEIPAQVKEGDSLDDMIHFFYLKCLGDFLQAISEDSTAYAENIEIE